MSGSSSRRPTSPEEQTGSVELDTLPPRDPALSLQARPPEATHLQNAIQASNNRDQAERQGWRGLSQNAARDILQQQGIEISQENVEYLRRDWDYENAGCEGLVNAMRSARPGWGGFRADRVDLSQATSLGNGAGLSLGQVEHAFEARLRQVLKEGLQQAGEDARSNPKYKYVSKLQSQRGFVDLEGQSGFNLDAQLTRASQRIIASPNYRAVLNAFVSRYKDLVDYLLRLQNGTGEANSADNKETELVELCKSFKEARGKLDAAWVGLDDYRAQIVSDGRTIIEDAYNSANTNDTTTRARRTLAIGTTTVVFTLVSAALLYTNYGLNWRHEGS